MKESSHPHIWILEDDKGCQFVYEQILKNNFETTYFENIKKFKESYKSKVEDEKDVKPDMIIADLMLNDGNFLNFLSNDFHGKLGHDVPFIVVSSDDDIESLRLCFKEGANDYITKPFKKNELLVKIETILKTRNRFGRTVRTQVEIDGVEIEGLTTKQQKLLSLFLNNTERAATRDVIMEKVWGSTAVLPKTIDVHLYNLRRKLQPYGYMIKSIGGGSWRLLSVRKDK